MKVVSSTVAHRRSGQRGRGRGPQRLRSRPGQRPDRDRRPRREGEERLQQRPARARDRARRDPLHRGGRDDVWVHDQVLATGEPEKVEVTVGAGGDAVLRRARRSSPSASRSWKATRTRASSPTATSSTSRGEDQSTGCCSTRSPARETRSSRPGAGRSKKSRPSRKPLPYNIYFIGDPRKRGGLRDHVPDATRIRGRMSEPRSPSRSLRPSARRGSRAAVAARRSPPTSATASTAACAAVSRGSTSAAT